jgi:transposase
LRAFFLRIRARRGHQIAAVAVARKLAILCWHLLTKSADYQWARLGNFFAEVMSLQAAWSWPKQTA